MKKIIQSFIVICLGMSFFVVPVHAETATYAVMSSECALIAHNGNYNFYVKVENNISEVRAVILRKSNTDNANLFLISNNSFDRQTRSGSNISGCTNSSTNTSVSSNGYAAIYANARWSWFGGVYTIPVIEENDYDSFTKAIYYTFGEGAVAPEEEEPSIQWGDLTGTGYYTKIAGQGKAALNNVDTITWNGNVDSNGNPLDIHCKAEIRVIPGLYSGNSIQDTLAKAYTDFVVDTLHATEFDEVEATAGTFSVTWDEVIDKLDYPFSGYLNVIKSSDVYIKRGWIYQIRLVNGHDEYEGTWQTIYTATSSGVENDLVIIDAEYNQTLINIINIINRRNDTDNNWYIGDITIIINPTPDPSASPDPGDGGSSSNWLLELIESILAFLGGLIGKLLELILSLFRLDSFDIPWFNDFKIQFKSNAGLFGQTLDFITDVKTIFTGTSYSDPIVTYPGIVLDGVQIVPAGSWNLNDYVTQFGLTDFRSTAYICTDGVIYISLLILTYRRLLEGLGGRRK